MRVALYARVSTGEQSPDMQLASLRKYAQQKEFAIAKEFVDVGFSGMSKSRPAFDKMLIAARSHEFDAIMVWKVDRLSRSLQDLLRVISDLQNWGVTFMSHSENIDMGTPAGRFMFSMIGAAAEFERNMIAERVRCGVRHAIASGRQWGRPKPQFDLSKIPPGTSVRDAAKLLGTNRESARKAIRAAAHTSDDPGAIGPIVAEQT